MDKQAVEFTVETKNGVIRRISNSVIEQPEIKFKGGKIKWFDDSKLIRKK